MNKITWGILGLLCFVCVACNETKEYVYKEEYRDIDFNLNWEFYKLSEKEAMEESSLPPDSDIWR
jgi:hypothetical protein